MRKKRAARFGIPVVEPSAIAPKGDADSAASTKRAERFGLPVKPAGEGGGKGKGKGKDKSGGKGKGGGKELSEEDKAKIAERKNRFGDLGGGDDASSKKRKEAPAAAPVDPEEEERRKKRMARFNQA